MTSEFLRVCGRDPAMALVWRQALSFDIRNLPNLCQPFEFFFPAP
jgi:hypothetical protein